MPINRRRYPKDWDAISKRIRERAGNRCEWCGVPNGEWGARDRHGEWWSDHELGQVDIDDSLDLFGPKVKMIKIVLTVAHLGVSYPDGSPGNKHNKFDVRDENLAALCQRCHLNYDREDHIRNAAITRRMKKVRAGQMELPLE